jgi:mxaK protein
MNAMAGRFNDFFKILATTRGRTLYGPILITLSLLCLASFCYGLFDLWYWSRVNTQIAQLNAGQDIDIDLDAPPTLLLARGHFLVLRDRYDATYPVLDALSRRAPDRVERSTLLYNLANARLRTAYRYAERNRFTEAIPLVNLAKDELRAALRISPTNWNFKHNLDVAMQLVREFPPAMQDVTDDSPESPEELWTDLPGRPEGLP